MRIKLESFLLLAFCGAFLLFWELRRGNHHVKVKRSTAKEKPLACSFYAVDEQIKLQMTGKQATEKQERKTQPRTARAETDKENTTITSKDVKLTIVATQSPGKGPEEKPKLTICPSVPPQSVGPVQVNKTNTAVAEQERLLPRLYPVKLGGVGQPKNCTQPQRVAIIVPFRDREWQLAIFLRHIHPILLRQQLDYRVFLIEQISVGLFNKGTLFNAGISEVESRFKGYYDCLVLQDVDILPEDDRIIYKCAAKQPMLLSKFIDRYNYTSQKIITTGGIFAISPKVYKEINGFSNAYYGWGGEDDDLRNRLEMKNYNISMLPSWARCGSLGHGGRERNEQRYEILKSSVQRQPVEGLNNANYTVSDYRELPLYTYVGVRVNIPNRDRYFKLIGLNITASK